MTEEQATFEPKNIFLTGGAGKNIMRIAITYRFASVHLHPMFDLYGISKEVFRLRQTRNF